MRALYFAPFGEMGLPQRFSGAVLSVASFMIYLPASFAYLLWGWLLDQYPGKTGYIYMFLLLSIIAGLGILVAHTLKRKIEGGTSARLAAQVAIIDRELNLEGKEKTLF